MGVNRAGFGIVDDEVVRAAAEQEVIRRYFRYACEHAMGWCRAGDRAANRAPHGGPGPSAPEDAGGRPPRQAAHQGQERARAAEGIFCGAAMSCPTAPSSPGKNSPLMHAASSLVLNALKHLAGSRTSHPPPVADDHPVGRHLKKDVLRRRSG
jgi:uncharacterized protein (UPF0371 family)